MEVSLVLSLTRLRCCLVESFWFWTLLIVTSIGSLPLFLYKGAASCLWLASKLEESPRKARQVLNAFHKIECRMQNLPIEHLEINSQASAQPFLVLGLLVTTLATSH